MPAPLPTAPVHVSYAHSDGNPLGKKMLGRQAYSWLVDGAASAAEALLCALEGGDGLATALLPGESVFGLMQRHLEVRRPPPGAERNCSMARSSVPTLTEALSTALNTTARQREAQSGVEGPPDLKSIRAAMRASPEHRMYCTPRMSEDRKQLEAHRLVAAAIAARCDGLAELNAAERAVQEEDLEIDLQATACRLDRRDLAGEPMLVRAASLHATEGKRVLTLRFASGGAAADEKRNGDANGGEGTAAREGLQSAGEARPTTLRNGSSVRLRGMGAFDEVAAVSRESFRGEAAVAAAAGRVVLSGRATRKTPELVDVLLDEGSDALQALGGEEALFSTGFAMFVGPDVRTFERNAQYIDTLRKLAKPKRLRESVASKTVLAAFGEAGVLPAPLGASGGTADGGLQAAADGADDGADCDGSDSGSDGDVAAARAIESVKKRVGATQLNAEQTHALACALDASRPVTVVQGPPGTGKSQVLEAVVRAAVDRGERVLVCAPSNAAVDNMVERLARAPSALASTRALDVVRSGNPERVTAAALSCLLASRAAEAAEVPRRAKLAQLAEIRRMLERHRLNSSDRMAERMDLTTRQRKLRRQIRALERDTARRLCAKADVVCCTLTGVGEDPVLRAAPYDLVVVDECAQATEPSSWGAVLSGRRAVLAGDVHQLGPTVVSTEAAEGGLCVTLMDRLSEAYGGALTVRLCEQYRMHAAISEWASRATYSGELRPAPGVATWLLADEPGIAPTRETLSPLALIDTAGQPGAEEMRATDGGSLLNLGEAYACEKHVRTLLAAGVAPRKIAVVSPYAAQVALLRTALSELEVEVATVDGWQGREADAVVLSMVRSNPQHTVGFLADERRLNVAATRARMHLAIVCDVATVGANPFIAGLLRATRISGISLKAALTADEATVSVTADEATVPVTADEATVTVE